MVCGDWVQEGAMGIRASFCFELDMYRKDI